MNILRRVGRYELESCLGGGMAWVYRARDTVMGRTVAVKILKETSDGGDAKRRFLQEAQVAAKLSHENVVRIYDFGEDDQNGPYMVMEYIPGQDLGKAIGEGGTGDLRAKLETAIQIAHALEYIHSQGIVHRDIKPENVCVTEEGNVKLMDFGIAKLGSVSMTQAGYTLGTPPYMAPEQIRSEAVTSLTDIYSFGVVLYELITGIKAFRADSYELVFYKVLNESINILPLREHGASQELCKFITRCAAKNPASRPQSFREVRIALSKMLEAEDARAALQARVGPASADIAPVAKERLRIKALLKRRIPLLVFGTAGTVLALALMLVISRLNPDGRNTGLPQQINTSTGVMVLVPAGPFVVGETQQPSTLPDFYIDRTEVTNAAYSAFCKATGRAVPPGFAADKPDYPIVNVAYADAETFSEWAGKRLPTSREWEKAARGTQGSRFPWGDDADSTRANVKNNSNRGSDDKLMPAAAFESIPSHFGALNMVGNAWEFVGERAEASPEVFEYFKRKLPNLSANGKWVRIRGGSYLEELDPSVGWNSASVPAELRNEVIGFRCVQDPKLPAR